MKIPLINTTKGTKEPLTIVPDNHLVRGFIFSDAPHEDKDMVYLLQYAEPDEEKSGSILRRCLDGKAKLFAFYPELDEPLPKNANLIGTIEDGALYEVLI